MHKRGLLITPMPEGTGFSLSRLGVAEAQSEPKRRWTEACLSRRTLPQRADVSRR